MDIDVAKAFLSQFTSQPLSLVDELLSDSERVKSLARRWRNKIIEMREKGTSAAALSRAYLIEDALISLAFEHNGRNNEEVDSIELPDETY